MNVALTYNLRHVKPSLTSKQAQEEAEFDTPENIAAIKAALESVGHQVFLVESTEAAYLKLKDLRKKIDLVFNYSEGVAGLDREAQIPSLLEILQIPYTGSGPLTSAILLNKARTKELLSYHGLSTPPWLLAKKGDSSKRSLLSQLRFPLMVKPNGEGSSKGIFNDSIVVSKGELARKVRRIFNEYKQDALIESYLEGKEFSVSMIQERGRWQVLPIVEVSFDELPPAMYPIDSYEAKWIYDSPEKEADPLICPAKINRELKNSIEAICLKACQVLNILDWCRIDLRLDDHGVANILEINSPPGIMPEPKENSRYPRAAAQAGIEFPQLLDRILKSALFRYN